MAKFALRMAVIGLLLLPSADAAAHPQPRNSLWKAYSFLAERMDKYGEGGTLRLAQSYVPTSTFSNSDISYTYDDDVLLIALLARDTSDDMARARVLGDSLLYVQQYDPLADGRVRAAYHARHLAKHDGAPDIAGAAADTGNLAWTGLALAQLYRTTGEQKYLSAAIAIGDFVQTNTFDTRGAGGYTGGFRGDEKKITYKSTEHNIDLYGLFTMLAQLTGKQNWSNHAQHALHFVRAMWNSRRNFFYIGTVDDGVTINKEDPTPEDVQTWSYLSTGSAQYQSSIDWAVENLSATEGGFEGLSFEVNDRSGVWFEGTAHAADALQARNLSGDAKTAAKLLADIEVGQEQAPNANGKGIDAASKDGLDTGEGDQYFASLHVGATAWYCLAKQAVNPFVLLPQH
ncbi:MAG TPA: hypothetical protein VHW69_10140 [Rhizomicrobium sp.]|nr:hypothetical protein [Rhizomicrobium sp.]